MSDQLSRFTTQCSEALKADPGPGGRERLRALLESLLQDSGFVDTYCVRAEPGLHLLYESPDLGFQVLAHVNRNPRVSPPHDHGESWAVYGQATRYTDMTEWRRLDDGADPSHAELEPIRRYRLLPGQAGIYQDGMIHSIDYPENSSFVRVTGTNLDRIARIMIDPASGKVTQMSRQRAT